ncbi:MAG: hypothetical protein PHQ52_00235 [Candidatus Omnitrophica bacterium]|jgi:hypothetical protein|nr:hypothetical protein [Candidatus Omnitrophota bacterium]
MKQYTAPKINSIELDQKQALLQVCKVGGLYVSRSISAWCGQFSGDGPLCNFTPKGGDGINVNMDMMTSVSNSMPPS